MGNDKRFLVVGAGLMGGNYARMLAAGRVPGASLAGIVDIDATMALEAGAETGSPAFGDIAHAITDTRPDAAYVATPDALHRKPLLDTSYQGISVVTDHQRYPAAFARSMDGLGPTLVTFDEGFEVTKILVAIHKSLESGNLEPV